MLFSTTSTLQGKDITEYLGVVTGEAVVGANIFKDWFASIRDVVGGRSGAYEDEFRKARELALDEMGREAKKLGGNGVIGIDVDYEVLGSNNTILMVSATGTAVIYR